jgi:hypothetical protein
VAGTVVVRTKVPGTTTWVTRATWPASFAAGDQLGARALQDGSVSAYKNGVALGTVNVTGGANPWPTAYAQGGGQIGVTFFGLFAPILNTDARFDNFGGGTMP